MSRVALHAKFDQQHGRRHWQVQQVLQPTIVRVLQKEVASLSRTGAASSPLVKIQGRSDAHNASRDTLGETGISGCKSLSLMEMPYINGSAMHACVRMLGYMTSLQQNGCATYALRKCKELAWTRVTSDGSSSVCRGSRKTAGKYWLLLTRLRAHLFRI